MDEKSRAVEPERIPSGPRATLPQRACDATPLERLELEEERRKLDALEAEYARRARVAEREHADAEEIHRHADYVQRELDRQGIYADGEPVRVSDDLVEIVPPSPLDPAVDYDERPPATGGVVRSHGFAFREQPCCFPVGADAVVAKRSGGGATLQECRERFAGPPSVGEPPLVAGGQGRSDDEVHRDAEGLFPAAVAGVALVLFGIAIGVGYWIGRAI